MPISSLLIIGNGFDLSCGLKTKYSDVYFEYIKAKSESKIINEFKASISKDDINWSDFELGMAEYAKHLSSESEFLECVNDFNSFMNNYLLQVQQKFHKELRGLINYDGIITEMELAIKSLGKDVTHDLNALINGRRSTNVQNLGVISLNYTNVFDLLYSKAFPNDFHNNIIHIHGLLSDDPVLGVDNDEQLSVPYPITNKSRVCFVKPYFNNEYDSVRVKHAKDIIEKSNTIFVYGASLGDSDLTWRNELLKWLTSSDTNHLFIYLYEYSKETYSTRQERINLEDDIKRNLLKIWKVDDFDRIIHQVHIPLGKNLFNIETAFNNDLKTSRDIIEKRDIKTSDLVKKIDSIKM